MARNIKYSMKVDTMLSGTFQLCKSADFFLNDTEVVRLAESRLCPRFHGEITIKITDRKGGKTGINHLILMRDLVCRPSFIWQWSCPFRQTGEKMDDSFRAKLQQMQKRVKEEEQNKSNSYQRRSDRGTR